MNYFHLVFLCAVGLLSACADTPAVAENPSAGQSVAAGGYTPTGNAVMDAAMQASAQAAASSAQTAAAEAAPPSPAVDSGTGFAPPYEPAADAAAPAPAATMGVFNQKPLVPAAQSGDVKIECYYSNFPPDREFIPMEVKISPLVRLDELVVRVDPEDGVIMRDGPMSKSIATPSDPFFRRIFAMRATDRDSYLRVSTLSKSSGHESRRSVLCPLARSNKVPDTGNP